MIPLIATIPATATPILQPNNPAPSQKIASPTQKSSAPTKVAGVNWKDRQPLTSPDLHTTPSLGLIAQSELPGGSNPPVPPPPSVRDTGDGYPTRIPRNYFGPTLSFRNGNTDVGVISRFPLGESYSIRPSVVFGGGGTILRVPITYDFVFGDKEPFERNPLVVVHAGAGVQVASGSNNQNSEFGLLGTVGVDVNLFEGIALIASYNTNFGSINGTHLGLGFEF